MGNLQLIIFGGGAFMSGVCVVGLVWLLLTLRSLLKERDTQRSELQRQALAMTALQAQVNATVRTRGRLYAENLEDVRAREVRYARLSQNALRDLLDLMNQCCPEMLKDTLKELDL